MLISCCGMDCEQCNAFIATQNDDNQLRTETAEIWSKQYNHPFKPEDINCTGCLEEGAKIGHCNVCPVRNCSTAKEVANCGKCEDFACDTLTNFFKLFPDNGQANMERLKNN